MRATEITYEIYNSLKESQQILIKQGFTLVEEFQMLDRYFSLIPSEHISRTPFQDVIKNSFLVRKVSIDNKWHTELIYKNKEFDKKGNVVSEEKVKTYIDNFEKTINILSSANFKPWAILNSINYVYKKDNNELVLQQVEDLGTFIEIEEFECMKNMSSEQKIINLENFANNLNLKKSQSSSVKKLELYIDRILK